MLDFKGFSVAVVDKNGAPFKEWGEQHLGNTTSCFIESENEKQFQITIQPFMYRWKMLFKYKDLGGPYNMLATLRIDGRENWERRVIVYLEQDHQFFPKHTDGEVMLQGKKVEDQRGVTRLYSWVFKEVGIDLLLDNLSLNDQADNGVDYDNKEPLAAAREEPGSNKVADKEEKSGMGMIELTLERVRVEQTASPRTNKETYAEVTPGNSTKTAQDQSHIATSTGGEIVKSTTHSIRYTRLPHDDDDGIFAKYKFFYRSKEVLRKFGFEGFPPPAAGDQGAPQPVGRAAASKGKRKEAELDDEEDDWYVSKSRKHATGIALPVILKK